MSAQNLEKEQNLFSRIEKVTVFPRGAQIVRKASVHLPKGKTVWVLSGLSPYLEVASLAVKGEGNFSILGINARKNLLGEEKRSEAVARLQAEIDLLNDSLEVLNMQEKLRAEEYDFLHSNKQISGENTSYTLEELSQVRDYYMGRMEKIQEELILLRHKKKVVEQEQAKRQQQIAELGAPHSGEGFYEVIIRVKAEEEVEAKFVISYLAGNAGWLPTYDLRVQSLDQPIGLTYQANLRQNTGEDWEQVQLFFSNARPNVSGQAPKLLPYRLYYGWEVQDHQASFYSTGNGILSGYVRDANSGNPLVGATVYIRGSSIGAVTDYNGYYELVLPATGPLEVEFAYVGYQTQMVDFVPSSGGTLNVALEEAMVLEEVTVTATKRRRSKPSEGATKPSYEDKSKKEWSVFSFHQNTTSVEFALDEPYTVLSGNASMKLDMAFIDMPATYVYQCTPKLDESAYLIAYIPDWRKHRLLPGELRLYFENTFVGRSLLDLKSAGDTLEISVGKDQGIEVERELVQDFSKTTILGGKRIVKRKYSITVRNNKTETVRIEVYDQIPLSSDKSIEVEALNYTGGQLDEESGKITWELELPSGKSMTLYNEYEVRYPKGKQLLVE